MIPTTDLVGSFFSATGSPSPGTCCCSNSVTISGILSASLIDTQHVVLFHAHAYSDADT